jgi:hypothetical protein
LHEKQHALWQRDGADIVTEVAAGKVMARVGIDGVAYRRAGAGEAQARGFGGAVSAAAVDRAAECSDGGVRALQMIIGLVITRHGLRRGTICRL